VIYTRTNIAPGEELTYDYKVIRMMRVLRVILFIRVSRVIR
jgi:hypothetical protein